MRTTSTSRARRSSSTAATTTPRHTRNRCPTTIAGVAIGAMVAVAVAATTMASSAVAAGCVNRNCPSLAMTASPIHYPSLTSARVSSAATARSRRTRFGWLHYTWTARRHSSSTSSSVTLASSHGRASYEHAFRAAVLFQRARRTQGPLAHWHS
jgi:hypothetical protein